MIETWDARTFDFENDGYYALCPTPAEVPDGIEVVIQDYFGDRTGHRIDAFAETENGCRGLTLCDGDSIVFYHQYI